MQDSGSSRIEDFIRLRDMRPFRTQHRDWLPARRSLFNRIVGEPGAGGFELRFARFLDDAPGVAAFAKNYLTVGFRLDYVKADGNLSTYTPTSSSGATTAASRSSKPRAAKSSTCRARWRAWRSGARTPLRPAWPRAGRATASSTSIKKASNDTRRSALRDSRPVSANTSKRLDASPETVNTAEMKTTFDLPDPLLRKAKAAAADQGRPLRDLVAEALAEKLAALALAKGARKSRDSEWKAFEARLEKLPDGTYVNPEIPEDDNFAQVLEAIREERLGWQPRNPFEPEADVDNPTAAPARSPARG